MYVVYNYKANDFYGNYKGWTFALYVFHCSRWHLV